MSKTFKQKVRHIFYDKDGNLNLRVPIKLRWSYINKIRRHNFDYVEDRAQWVDTKDRTSKADMKNQIKEL